MKKLSLILLSVYCIHINGYTQSSSANNTWVAGRYLGWNGNNALEFRTNNVNRMKLNGNVNYTINGSNAARNGYLLLGGDGAGPISGTSLYNNYGAFSMLHLNGRAQGWSGMIETGYRYWMQTGITFTDNADLSYIGLRKVGTGTDITETTIAWTNAPGVSPYGPDDMVFRFTNEANRITSSEADMIL